MVIIAAIFAWLTLSSVVQEVCCEQRQKAIIHIGPPKTGTTYLQGILVREKELLMNKRYVHLGQCVHTNGYVFLYFNDNHPIELYQAFTRHLVHGNACWMSPKEIELFFRRRMRKKENILFSSVFLFSPNATLVQKLRKKFENYDVTIVFFYRNLINLELSVMNQLSKYSTRWEYQKWPMRPFFIDRPKINPLRNQQVINEYGKVFGRENIISIDYYGVLASGLDVSDVFFCEVLNVSCQNGKAFLRHSDIRELDGNPSQSLEKMQMLQLFYEYVVTRNCSFGVKNVPDILEYQWKLKPPRISRNLEREITHSLHHDKLFRQYLGNMPMLYANQTANEIAANSILFSEVDSPMVHSSRAWLNEFSHAFNILRHKAVFC